MTDTRRKGRAFRCRYEGQLAAAQTMGNKAAKSALPKTSRKV